MDAIPEPTPAEPTPPAAPAGATGLAARAVAWQERLLAHPLYKRWSDAVYLVILFWCIYALSGTLKATVYNAHVYLAKAFLEGHFHLIDAPGHFEQTKHLGNVYLAYGIGPTLLMLPFVAIWGLAFHQPLFCALLAAIAVAVWWEILGKLGHEGALRTWLTGCFGLGSLFWFYAGQNGNTWAIMHVTVCLGLLVAIYDCVGKQRAWLAGLGLGLAVLSRQTVFLALPFFVAMLWRDDRATGGRSVPAKALLFALGLGALMGFNAFYNWARFGSLTDNGYARVISEYQNLPGGFFGLSYLQQNLDVYIWGRPERIQAFPWFNPTQGGFSMLISTPALIFAVMANYRERINLMALIAIAPILGFYLVYHWTGYAQFGCRYSLDFMPFAMLLIASGVARARWDSVFSGAVLFGALVEIWGLFWWGIKEW